MGIPIQRLWPALALATACSISCRAGEESPDLAPLPDVEDLPVIADLPEPFEALDGTRIETDEQWRTLRRPELERLFLHYVYGRMPAAPRVIATREQEDVLVLDGKVTLSQIELRFEGLPEAAPSIHLALFLPSAAQGPVPIFLGLNKCGNHTVLSHAALPVRDRAWRMDYCNPEEEKGLPGAKADAWCVDLLAERGWGLATFCVADIDPDRDDFTDGIHPWYPELANTADGWGSIAAWAWGLMRAVDFLVEEERVDSGRIALIGHSRRGKTALLAGALDERIALVVPHQSGTGGAALSRNNDQETLERITRVFPHWFNHVFPRFAGRESLLPIDQHLLVALVAPRPLLETVGLQDTWTNYESSLIGLRAASPVWSLHGTTGMIGTGVIEAGTPIDSETCGRLAQVRLDTKHVLNADYWNLILDFADLNLGR